MTFDDSTTIKASKRGHDTTAARGLDEDVQGAGQPNRFKLFLEILEAGKSSFDQEGLGHSCFLHTIMDRLEIGAPTVSHHLKELVNANLVTTERQGKFVTCQVNAAAVDQLAQFFSR